jgi:uncharacterized protein YjdB
LKRFTKIYIILLYDLSKMMEDCMYEKKVCMFWGILLGLAVLGVNGKAFDVAAETTVYDKTDYYGIYWDDNDLDQYDADGDGKLSESEAKKVTKLELVLISKEQKKLVEKLEYFPNLKTLEIVDSKYITSLDLSENTKLEELTCTETAIKKLDLSKYKNLKKIGIAFNNKLTTVKIGDNNNLKSVECLGNSKLTKLSIGKTPNLSWLYCSTNKLASLDVSKCTALKELECDNNNLTSLNLKKNTKLEYLDFTDNKIKSLDVSSCSKLLEIFCSGNKLKSLKLNNQKHMGIVTCDKNVTVSLSKYVSGVRVFKGKDYKITHFSSEPEVTGVSLNKKTLTLTASSSATLKATIKPKDATVRSLTWSSSNSKVATIDNTGKVKALKTGKTTITVSANDGSGKKATCVVTVTAKSTSNSTNTTTNTTNTTATTPEISGPSVVWVGNSITFKVTNGVTGGKWYSSDSSVLSGGGSGSSCKMTGKKAGTAYVYYKANGKTSKKIKVQVRGV